MKRMSCSALCVLVGIFLVSCGSDTDSPDADTCKTACPRTVAAGCAEGPTTDEDCLSGCNELLAACPTEMAALLACSPGKEVSCDADGNPVPDGCETEYDALMACIGG